MGVDSWWPDLPPGFVLEEADCRSRDGVAPSRVPQVSHGSLHASAAGEWGAAEGTIPPQLLKPSPHSSGLEPNLGPASCSGLEAGGLPFFGSGGRSTPSPHPWGWEQHHSLWQLSTKKPLLPSTHYSPPFHLVPPAPFSLTRRMCQGTPLSNMNVEAPTALE